MIRFFDTLEGKVKEFDPKPPQTVKLYTCGPTVYDYAHIGNFRTFIFEDLLRRFLEYAGYKVQHVMNITDVDDKTIAGANHAGESLEAFTERFTEAFQQDLETLNILKPNFPEEQPRATREIKVMITLVERLIKKEAAYIRDGSVYFRVSGFKPYGKLSKKKLEMNIEGARVDVDEYDKEAGCDFVLWKKVKAGEPAWDSPWGKGRPGWHLECSAMSMKYLGETFDIHAGGEDLVFPHHENEIAQSEAATGKAFVRYWLHCKFLLVDGRKMSKSLGNFYTLRDLLAKKYDPMVIRYALISTHYRTQLNFTLDTLNARRSNLESLEMFYKSVKDYLALGRRFSQKDFWAAEIQTLHSRISEALEDDLNVSKALAAFFEFSGRAETPIKKGEMSVRDREALLGLMDDFFKKILGLLIDKPIPDEIMAKVKVRDALRKQKKYAEADKIRIEVENSGFLVWDESTGTSGVTRK